MMNIPKKINKDILLDKEEEFTIKRGNQRLDSKIIIVGSGIYLQHKSKKKKKILMGRFDI